MPERLRIVVVDDNRSAADALVRVLAKAGDDVRACYDGATAIDLIASQRPDLVLTDLKMEPVDGLEVLRAARDQRPPVECIVFTAFGDVDIAVEAMRLGARDFLTKPVSAEQLASRISSLRGEGEPDDDPEAFVARAPRSKALLDDLRRAATVPSRVWIEGEMGSGRVYCARTIHALSGDPGPLHIMDPGVPFTWPEQGTAVLPNVDDLPADLQRQLARRLQGVPSTLRLITTASPDSRALVTKGQLRADLYYALAVVTVEVPALRDRREDIRPLFERALDRFSQRYGRPRPQPDETSWRDLERHAWPGNVRELLNAAERMVVMGTHGASISVIEPTSRGLPNLEPGFSLSAYLEETERRILEEALRLAGGDRAEAGRMLGVERNTLRYKLNKYGLLERS